MEEEKTTNAHNLNEFAIKCAIIVRFLFLFVCYRLLFADDVQAAVLTFPLCCLNCIRCNRKRRKRSKGIHKFLVYWTPRHRQLNIRQSSAVASKSFLTQVRMHCPNFECLFMESDFRRQQYFSISMNTFISSASAGFGMTGDL